MIQLQNVSKVFSTKDRSVEAVKDISLNIEKGVIFGIIGLSGAGKSTLVRCINFLEKPTSGSVIFEGVDLASLKHSALLEKRRSMSMIFQGFNLLSQRTALKNVCFPLEIAGIPKKTAIEKARGLLKLVGLEERENAYPSQLSGGQKQRVAIARALASDPQVLLCDEATSALDPTTTTAILELLKRINRDLGVTIIVITHEMKVVEQICNKVAVLDNGELVECGYVKDVFTSPKTAKAKELILPKGKSVKKMQGGKVIRIVFDGQAASEPVISNLTIECQTAVNILQADTKAIEEKAYGEMLIELPLDETSSARVLGYLKDRKIHFEEVTEDVE